MHHNSERSLTIPKTRETLTLEHRYVEKKRMVPVGAVRFDDVERSDESYLVGERS